MVISEKQQEIGLKWLGNICCKYWSEKSEVVEWWDKLILEWCGVVLYVVVVVFGMDVFKVYLSKCYWLELFECLDYWVMIQLCQGIFRVCLMFEGFGSLSDSDFLKCSVNCQVKKVYLIYSSNGVQMIIVFYIVYKM